MAWTDLTEGVMRMVRRPLAEKTRVCMSRVSYFDAEQLKIICDHFGAVHVGCVAVKKSVGGWTSVPYDVFHQAELKEENHEHFFAFWRNNGKMIIAGLPDFDPTYPGVYIPKVDAFIMSRYRHDFYRPDGSPVAIDGGPDYLRLVGDVHAAESAHINLLTRDIIVSDRGIRDGTETTHCDSVLRPEKPRKNNSR